MYLKNIKIKNFRCIQETEISFQQGINLIIGDNAVGKTAILEAICVGLSGFLDGIPEINGVGFHQEDFRQEVVKIADASSHINYHEVGVDLSFEAEEKQIACSRNRKDSTAAGKTVSNGTELKNYAQSITGNADSKLPLLSYMSISRVTSTRRADYGKSKKNRLNDRRCGYIGCLESVPDKNSLLEWVKKMAYESVLQNKQTQEKALFDKIVSAFMQQMNGLKIAPKVEYSGIYDGLVYYENEEALPIGFLSAGYQSLLWMVMDFAYRTAQLNPTMTDPASAEGIVLIDEIDMHLHPKWQWKVLGALQSVFPNVQFIVTTHAPIVISSLKSARLIKVDDKQQVTYPASAYAYPVGDVLEARQDSNGLEKGLENAIASFDDSLNEGKLEDAKRQLDDMTEKFGAENPAVLSSKTEYELETISVDE